MKNTTEKKNTLDWNQQIRWYRGMDLQTGSQSRANHPSWTEKRKKKSEDRLLRDLQDNIKCINICMIEVYQENKEAKNIFEDKGSATLNWFYKKY